MGGLSTGRLTTKIWDLQGDEKLNGLFEAPDLIQGSVRVSEGLCRSASGILLLTPRNANHKTTEEAASKKRAYLEF